MAKATSKYKKPRTDAWVDLKVKKSGTSSTDSKSSGGKSVPTPKKSYHKMGRKK